MGRDGPSFGLHALFTGGYRLRNGPFACVLFMALWGVLCFPLGRLIKLFRLDWDRAPFAQWRWERDGQVYERAGIRRWKDLVPDVSKLFPSIVPPKAVQGMPDAATLRDMLKETCVAEAVHVVLIPLGLWLLRLWQGIGGVMMFLVYVILGNVPFIMIQRYNRPRFRRMLAVAEARERRRTDARTDTVQQ